VAGRRYTRNQTWEQGTTGSEEGTAVEDGRNTALVPGPHSATRPGVHENCISRSRRRVQRVEQMWKEVGQTSSAPFCAVMIGPIRTAVEPSYRNLYKYVFK